VPARGGGCVQQGGGAPADHNQGIEHCTLYTVHCTLYSIVYSEPVALITSQDPDSIVSVDPDQGRAKWFPKAENGFNCVSRSGSRQAEWFPKAEN